MTWSTIARAPRGRARTAAATGRAAAAAVAAAHPSPAPSAATGCSLHAPASSVRRSLGATSMRAGVWGAQVPGEAGRPAVANAPPCVPSSPPRRPHDPHARRQRDGRAAGILCVARSSACARLPARAVAAEPGARAEGADGALRGPAASHRTNVRLRPPNMLPIPATPDGLATNLSLYATQYLGYPAAEATRMLQARARSRPFGETRCSAARGHRC
jgi:hypothetical protein